MSKELADKVGLVDNEEREVCNKEMKIITLCGSSSFKNTFEQISAELTITGNIVFSLPIYEKHDKIMLDKLAITPLSDNARKCLEKIHFAKIDMSDEIFVINVNNYIGESTHREIEYARQKGKKIRFLNSNMRDKIYELSQEVELW